MQPSLPENPYHSPQGVDPSPAPSFNRLSVFLAAVSFLVFLFCLPFDGYYIARDGMQKADPAWGLLLIGWLGLGETPAWLANPLLLLTWVLIAMRQGHAASGTSVAALGMSLSFLLKEDIICNEAGGRSELIGYGFGYWLWNLSIFISLLAALVALAEMPPKLTDDREWWREHRQRTRKQKSPVTE